MKKLIVMVSGLTLLSACTTFDPYTGEQETSKTAIGASIGAGIGAVAAYIKNKDEDSRRRNQRILGAAVGGAAIGGGIGYYMDMQEAKLRKQLRGTGVSVQREGNNINLIMPGNITFDTGVESIKAEFYPVLNSVALVLQEYNKTIVAVSGHTDSVGSEQSNQVLSEQRAASVANYLRGQQILSERLEIIGFGESQPIASNSTAEGRQLNRRAEITILPVATQ